MLSCFAHIWWDLPSLFSFDCFLFLFSTCLSFDRGRKAPQLSSPVSCSSPKEFAFRAEVAFFWGFQPHHGLPWPNLQAIILRKAVKSIDRWKILKLRCQESSQLSSQLAGQVLISRCPSWPNISFALQGRRRSVRTFLWVWGDDPQFFDVLSRWMGGFGLKNFFDVLEKMSSSEDKTRQPPY